MKGFLGLFRHKSEPEPDQERLDSMLFTTNVDESDAHAHPMVAWETRALEVEATGLDPDAGIRRLQELWASDKYMQQLDPQAIGRLQRFFAFATVAGGHDLIRQDEYGNFMLVLLRGPMAIERLLPAGARQRLAEAEPGEMIGEMSLLDSGIRLSACTTASDCDIAVLSADALDQMLEADPALAANLIALLARKLSLRMRAVSARFNDHK